MSKMDLFGHIIAYLAGLFVQPSAPERISHLALGTLVGGAFYIELIFNIPGIAGITLASATSRDYPVIQATTVLLTITIVLGNVLADVLYAVVDPHIKIE